MANLRRAVSRQCKRILIADETAGGRALLREILAADSYFVREADDTEHVLRLVHTFNPDLVILDLQMKKIDAFALAQLLSNLKLPAHLPLIALSPAVTQTSPERIVKAGFSAYLVKPISPFELRNCVSVLLAR